MQIRRTKKGGGATILVLAIVVAGLWIGHSVRRALAERTQSRDQIVAAAIRDLQISDSWSHRLWETIWTLIPQRAQDEFIEFRPANVAAVRHDALGILSALTPESYRALPVLMRVFLDSGYDAVRGEIADTLASFGPVAKPALPLLIQDLRDDENIGSPGISDARRSSMIYGIARIGLDNSETEEILCRRFKQINQANVYSSTAGAVVGAMVLVATPTNHIIPLLAGALENDLPQLRGAIINALGDIGPKSPLVVDALITALKQKRQFDGIAILRALNKIGPAARDAVPVLTNLFDEAKAQHLKMQQAMTRISDQPPSPLFSTGRMLKPGNFGPRKPSDPRSPLGVETLMTLGTINSAETIPFFEKEYMTPDSVYRFDAATARWQIDRRTDSVLPIYEAGLLDPSPELRRIALRCANQLGMEARPIILKALQNPDAQVRFIALRMVFDWGATNAPPLKEIEPYLKDSSFAVRVVALDIFERAGPAAAAFGPSIEPLLNDPKNMVRMAAEKTLRAIRPQEAVK